MQKVQTGDLFRAAYLKSCGGEVSSVEVEPSGHVLLTLSGPMLRMEDNHYQQGEGRCNPLQLRAHLNELRDLVRCSTQERINGKARRMTHAGTHP